MTAAALSETMPILPLSGRVILPLTEVELPFGARATEQAIGWVLAKGGRELVALAQKDAAKVDPTIDDLYHVGVRLFLTGTVSTSTGMRATAVAGERMRLLSSADAQVLAGVFVELPRPTDLDGEVVTLTRDMLELVKLLARLGSPEARVAAALAATLDVDPLDQVYQLATALAWPVVQAQALLEAPRRIDALRLMRHCLDAEIAVWSAGNADGGKSGPFKGRTTDDDHDHQSARTQD